MADAQMIFGASFDKVSACAAGSATAHSTFVWNATNVVAWIKHMQDADLPVWAYELGNEVNNQGVGPDGEPDRHNCSLLPTQQAAAIELLAATLKELYPDAEARPKLIGPDTGFKNPQGWLNETLDRVGHLLHAVTHHVYLGAARKNYNSVKMLNRGLNDIGWYVPLVKDHAPAAQVWAGEDGPTGGGDSGTCGDPTTAICGLYGSALWYADDMGQRAAHGFQQYQRQDLVGAHYSLVTMPHDNEFLGPHDSVGLTADFWVNFLWKRTVGTHVLDATVLGSETVRAYVHCGVAPSPHKIRDAAATAVLINLDNTTSVPVALTGATRLQAWTLSPTPDGGEKRTSFRLICPRVYTHTAARNRNQIESEHRVGFVGAACRTVWYRGHAQWQAAAGGYIRCSHAHIHSSASKASAGSGADTAADLSVLRSD